MATGRVNPAYRDFLAALAAMERGLAPWRAYERYYLRAHRSVLLAYWCQCWGADPSCVREMVCDLRTDDYRALRDALRAVDVEAIANEALQRCCSLISLPTPQVDLLVGRFSPDAFLLEVGGQWHLGVGLERFSDFSALPLFIAHEYGHYARRLLAPPPATLGDRMVAEGMAVAFARTAYPHQPLTRHLSMSSRRLHEIRELETRLWSALTPHLEAAESQALAGVISSARRWRNFPPRFGIYLGYRAVRYFARARGHPFASRESLSAPSATVIGAYLARVCANSPNALG